MKKNIIYCLLVAVISLFFSCTREEDDLFDESAALRLNKIINEAQEILLAPEKGWIMEYFPNENSSGVMYLIKFGKTEMATMATINQYVPQYTEASGYWRVIADNGPVLSFDTYNDIFHIYADPAAPGASIADGKGLEGDYEFIIIEKTADQFKLMGKKHGAIVLMHKFPEDQEWKNYLLKIKEFDNSLFSANAPDLQLTFEGSEVAYSLSGGNTHIFTMLPSPAQVTDEEVLIPFILTEKGIRFVKPFDINDQRVQTFQLSEDRSYLYAIENSGIRITNPILPLPFFLDEKNWTQNLMWTINGSNLSDAFQTAYTKVVDGCKTIYKEDFNSFFFQYKSARKSKTLSFKSGTSKVYEGAFDFDILQNPGKEGEIIFVDKGTTDNNAKLYKSRIEGFGEMLDLITSGPFTVTTDNPLSMSALKFTSISNPDNWFTLSLTK
jgi:hypothetical protein